MRKVLSGVSLFLAIALVQSCGSSAESTEDIAAVESLDLQRYSGTWYEIARLPNRFEEGLINITATYTLKEDGSIAVLNRGFNVEDNEWQEADGDAHVEQPPATLEVSFFWFFGSTYKVIALDQERYQWAMVTSSTKDYLWILGRSPHMESDIYEMLVERARGWGFAVDKLIKVKQKPLDQV